MNLGGTQTFSVLPLQYSALQPRPGNYRRGPGPEGGRQVTSPDGHCSRVCVPACCGGGGAEEGALLGRLLGAGGEG